MKKNNTLKSREKSTRTTGKPKGKAVILLKEGKAKTLTFHQHGGLTQNFEKS